MKSWSVFIGFAVVCADVDDTTSLLQVNKHKDQEFEDCYVKGGCKTTTTTPSIEEMVVTQPEDVIVDKPKPDTDVERDHYCGPQAAEFINTNLKNPAVNNLGGVGPGGRGSGRWKGKQVIAYECGMKQDGKCVDIVISAVGNNYYNAHKGKRKWMRWGWVEGDDFLAEYNGDFRDNVVSIGSLFKGEYKFKFSFYDENKDPVVIDYLPMTFYDLDGTAGLAGDVRYEEVLTQDAEGVVVFAHSTLARVKPIKHSCSQQACRVESVTQEVDEPDSYDTLTDDEKSAAATFLFAGKSSIELSYKLNYDHRVMFFKGSKALYCKD